MEAGAIQRAGKQSCALALALAAMPAMAHQAPGDPLADLSLEELSNIEITSVSKRAQRLSDSPASIFVITAEDIRRSGVTSLPEALRLAPNLEVARVSSGSYAISSRGFNNAIGNKLQVLLDGRILYTPLFSGVTWDTPDVMLEDVDRIEVISGPAATLFGANAVNGVINVITRRSSETQGVLASVSAGDRQQNYALRFGSSAGGTSYRIYGKFFERDPTAQASGATQHDGWHRGEIGFRADWGTLTNGFTLQGAAYRGEIDTVRPDDIRISGGNLLARWNRQLASGNNVRLQAYFDRLERENLGSISDLLKIYDIEFQHDIAGIEGHALTWGINHRGANDQVNNHVPSRAILPAERNLHRTSLFIQDEIALRGDRLKFIGGLRVEHNTYTGTEVLPTLRMTWRSSESQLVWIGASRAVRTPSRLDRDFFAPRQPPFTLAGGPDFRSEVANVFEVGYRAQPSPKFSYSLTAFHHDYDHLRSFERRPTNSTLANKMEGTGRGLEAWGTVQMTQSWRLSAGVTLLDLDLRLKPDSTDPLGPSAAGNDPEYQWLLRSSLDLPGQWEFDTTVRHVDALPAPHVPAYTAVDMRLGWRPHPRFELSLTGQNVFDSQHVEAQAGSAARPSQIPREFRVGVKWSF